MRRAASALLTAALCACAETSAAPDDAPLRLVRTVKLPGVEGRIDHLARDAKRGRLFVAALGNGSVEVVSLAKFEREKTIGGLEEPQGVAFVAGADYFVVACGGDGTVRLLAGEKLTETATVKLSGDADNVRWNEATKKLVVAYGAGGLASMAVTMPPEMPATIALGAHPEGFQVEASGARAFVNLASRGEVAVVDLAAKKESARWELGVASANYPMALDEPGKRLYIGCRTPAKLVVVSTEDGKVVASPDCAGDPDDVFVDAAGKRVYVICGAGEIDVFDVAGGVPKLVAKVPTEKGARTGLLEGDRLWLAVPKRGGADAEIREYEPR